MAKGQNFNGELIHFGAQRFRVTGSGNLQLFLRSLDDIRNVTLTSIAMQSVTNREPVVLSNFIEQRAQLEIRTSVYDDQFNISKIVIFIRPVATGYAQ